MNTIAKLFILSSVYEDTHTKKFVIERAVLVLEERRFFFAEEQRDSGKGTYIRDAEIIIDDRGRTGPSRGVEVLDLFFLVYVDMDVMYIKPKSLANNLFSSCFGISLASCFLESPFPVVIAV